MKDPLKIFKRSSLTKNTFYRHKNLYRSSKDMGHLEVSHGTEFLDFTTFILIEEGFTTYTEPHLSFFFDLLKDFYTKKI